MESGSGRTLLFIGRRPPVYFNEEPLLLHLWFSARSICRLVLLLFSLSNWSLQLTHYIKRKCDITQTKQSPSAAGLSRQYIGSALLLPTAAAYLHFSSWFPLSSISHTVSYLLFSSFIDTVTHFYSPPLPHQTADSLKTS